MRRWFEQEYVLKDFEGFIKSYATRDFIYFFAEKSIEIYKNQVEKSDEHLVCNITFPLNIMQHGFTHKQVKVMLSAWDIPNMAYLSICLCHLHFISSAP